MKNNNQNHISEELHIDSPPVLTEKIQHAFGKAAEYNLTIEEKKKGAADLKEFMNKNVPVNVPIVSGSTEDTVNTLVSPKSPYAKYIISTTAFFGNFHKQFSSVFNSKQTKDFIHVHRKKIKQASLVTCLIFVFAAGTAKAANSSLPGDLLYPIKIKINEPIESVLAVSPKAKAKVAVKHAVERVKEASELSLAGKITPKNEDIINTEITAKSEEARQSIIRLKTDGQTNIANDITVDFENSVGVYKRNIEAFSKFNPTVENNDVLKKVINTLDGEIQKISNPSINDFKNREDRHRNEKVDTRNKNYERGRNNRDLDSDNELYKQKENGRVFQKYENTNTTSLPIVTGTSSQLVTATTSISSTTEFISSSSQIIQTQPASSVSVDTTVSSAPIPTVQTSVSIPSTIVAPSVQINLK